MNRRASFISELRRRNVFRAATFYAASAWLLVEVVTQLSSLFDVPNWAVRWIVISAVVGFPFAMTFAWLYEWTPSGIKRESDIAAGDSVTHLTGKQLDRLIILVLALAMLVLLANKFVLHPRMLALQDHSIAVLPLVNANRDAQEQYFSDGLSEDLIAALSRFHGLKVINRNSTFKFRDSHEDSNSIGKQLGAAHLLGGSVRRQGGRIEVMLELIRAQDGSTLWSQRYERPYADLFVLQDEISASVVHALQARLVPGSRRATTGDRPASGDLDAYNAFLQGSFYEARGSEADYRKAIDYYTQASKIDPGYANAHAAQSLVTTRLAGRFLEGDAMRDAYAMARKEAAQALALAPDSALAYLARGRLRVWADFDWRRGEADFQRALQLDPGNDAARIALGEVEASLGRPAVAARLTEQALVNDSLNARAWHALGTYLMSLQRLDEAAAKFHKAAELQPGMFGNQEQLAIIAILRGDAAAAMHEAQLEHAGDWRNAALARSLQIGQDRKAADAALADLIAHQAGKAAYQIAQVQALRGEADQAFFWLDRAWANRDAGISLLLFDPLMVNLRTDPRFVQFCAKAGLPAAPISLAHPTTSLAVRHFSFTPASAIENTIV